MATKKKAARKPSTTHGWEGSKSKKPPFHGAAAPFGKGKANPRFQGSKKGSK